MTTQIPDKITQIAPEAAAKYLAEGYLRATGKRPSIAILKLLVAQSALETGNWKIFHNWNFGNHKASGSDALSQVYTIGDDPTDPGARYAAFRTPEEGAEHYVLTLTKREHWKKGLESGKPLTFIRALSTPPVYFTADPQTYLVTMTKLIDQYEELAKKYGTSILGVMLGLFFTLASGAGVYIALKSK